LAPRWLFGALWRLFRWLLHLLYFSSLTSEFLEAASKLLFGIGSCKGREGGYRYWSLLKSTPFLCEAC
jgi:hypothetical protein